MTDIEFEYADYCIDILRNSCQTFDDIDDWIDSKTHMYDERLSNKELQEIRAILTEDNWIVKDTKSTLYSLDKSKLTILKKYGSYSNYCKYLDNENQLLKSKLDDKLQLETNVLKLQKESLEKSSKVIIDVFELVNYKPVLTYRISVVDKFIILVSNKGVPSTGASFAIDKQVREKLVLDDLNENEKFDYGSQLTHKFKIKEFGKKYLYLNLTDDDLIKLGFIEKPPIIKFKLNENKRWFIGLSVMALIGIASIVFNNSKESKKYDARDTNQIRQEQKTTPLKKESEFSQSDSSTVPVDSANISKNESLTKKLK